MYKNNHNTNNINYQHIHWFILMDILESIIDNRIIKKFIYYLNDPTKTSF